MKLGMRNLGIVASAGAMIVSTGFVLTSSAANAASSKMPTYEIG